jgi:hypothetical protein
MKHNTVRCENRNLAYSESWRLAGFDFCVFKVRKKRVDTGTGVHATDREIFRTEKS